MNFHSHMKKPKFPLWWCLRWAFWRFSHFSDKLQRIWMGSARHFFPFNLLCPLLEVHHKPMRGKQSIKPIHNCNCRAHTFNISFRWWAWNDLIYLQFPIGSTMPEPFLPATKWMMMIVDGWMVERREHLSAYESFESICKLITLQHGTWWAALISHTRPRPAS